jgi:hypothetical protein
MTSRGFGHLAVDGDGGVIRRGGVYHGGVLLATSGGASTVAVYDGLDTSGDLIDYFSVSASAGERHVDDVGIQIREGLYVDVGSNVSKLTIFYDPPEGSEV